MDWKDKIKVSFREGKELKNLFRKERSDFLQTIWTESLTAFDIPREVQVIIDSNNNLFMSVGSPSFVSFMGQEKELYENKMKLPIKCWIHTHPFGKAYFSGTDISTINTWSPIMLTAIVLGDNEHQLWRKARPGEAMLVKYSSEEIVSLENERETIEELI